MTTDAWVTLAVTAALVIVLVRDLLPPTGAVLTAVVALLVTDVIGPDQAFSGFSNAAPITVAALYVVAAGVVRTGLLTPLMASLLGGAHTTDRRALTRLAGAAGASSAFLNNTPIVAMLLPEVESWAERHSRSVSRLLMPLSFMTILGGVVTAIGTSTNLVVSGLLESSGREPLSLFELSSVGLPVAVLGGLCIVVLAPVLLPDRRGARSSLTDEAGRGFVLQMLVQRGGPLDGQTVGEAGLRNLSGVFLVEVARGDVRIAPVTPTTVLRGDDELTFVGKVDLVVDLQRRPGLVSTEHAHIGAIDADRHTFFEAVIGAASPLVGRTLADAGFRGRYQAAVMAIHRAGERVDAKLGQVRLRPGDTLLLLAGDDFRTTWSDRRDFLLVSRLGGSMPIMGRRGPVAGVIMAAVCVVAATGMLPILESALLGAGAMVATGVLTPNEARQAVDLDVVVLIGAAFGIGAAMESSGLAAEVAAALVDVFSGFGDRGVLLGLVLATVVLTEMVTNNAAAVLMFPVAIAAAPAASLDPRSAAIAVAVAASASFLTPIGYQTNTMVYGPGGYRFGDYARLGLPLTLVTCAVLVTIIPVL